MIKTDGNLQTDIDSTTDQVVFELLGGLYQVAAQATWGGGSATLEMLGPDGTNYLTVSDPITADGGQSLYLPPGRYRWTIVTATGASLGCHRIPLG